MQHHHDQFLATADRIGNVLCRDAIWDGIRCNWLGWSMEWVRPQWENVYRSMPADLYNGTAGIALFLAELSRLTGDSLQRSAALGAINQVISVADRMHGGQKFGLYTGQLGMAYSAIRVGQLFDKKDLLDWGFHHINALQDIEPNAQFIDVLGGSAGLILALLALAKTYDRPDWISTAISHGQFLVDQAQRSEYGCSWKTISVKDQANLTGYSHGVAGIVTALLALYQVTNEVVFLNTALEGLRYEQQFFNVKKGNWQDLRVMNDLPKKTDEENFYMGWCHGAPGIGLSRLHCVEILRDHSLLQDDLEIAIQTTAIAMTSLWKVGQGNYSLCHGASGNVELLIEAGRKLHRPALTEIAEKVGKEGISHYVEGGLPWPCGVSKAGETPNLMLGTSGIGYFYLRLYDSSAIPSLLLIAP